MHLVYKLLLVDDLHHSLGVCFDLVHLHHLVEVVVLEDLLELAFYHRLLKLSFDYVEGLQVGVEVRVSPLHALETAVG